MERDGGERSCGSGERDGEQPFQVEIASALGTKVDVVGAPADILDLLTQVEDSLDAR
jgi:hypothetical protein